MTDPATELAEIALAIGSSSWSGRAPTGATLMARQFEVLAWSTDFYRIMTCILERVDLVHSLLNESDADSSVVTQGMEDLYAFQRAFDGNRLCITLDKDKNSHSTLQGMSRPLIYISSVIKRQQSYPKLDAQEAADLYIAIEAYIQMLTDLPADPGFHKQAIIEGLKAFKFRLVKMRWMGAGYVLSSFRDLLHNFRYAQEQADISGNPDAKAALVGMWSILRSFKEKAETAKGWSETYTWVWDTYKTLSPWVAPLAIAFRPG